MATFTGQPRVSKRMRSDSPGPSDLQSGTTMRLMPARPLALSLVPYSEEQMADAAAKAVEHLTRPLERLTISVNPKYRQDLKSAGVTGWTSNRADPVLGNAVIDLNLVALRRSMEYVFRNFLSWKATERGDRTPAEVTIFVNRCVPLTVNAVMSAIYAKLCMIHMQSTQYSGRYPTRPVYNKTTELPLPFADAVNNLGIVEVSDVSPHVLYMPTHPEGTRYQGHSDDNFNMADYTCLIPYLKECGIPFLGVDTNRKDVSAWWLYRIVKRENTYDFECIFPPLIYSDHSSLLAALFLYEVGDPGVLQPIIDVLDTAPVYESAPP